MLKLKHKEKKSKIYRISDLVITILAIIVFIWYVKSTNNGKVSNSNIIQNVMYNNTKVDNLTNQSENIENLINQSESKSTSINNIIN